MLSNKFQTAFAKKALISPIKQQTSRQFSGRVTSGLGQSVAMGVGCAGILGLTSLMYMGHQARMREPPSQ